MSTYATYQSAARWTLAAAVAALSACASGTAPKEPGVAAGVVGETAKVMHDVYVQFHTLTVMGSCDHNSIFETKEDGEFELYVSVHDSQGAIRDWFATFSGSLKEDEYLAPRDWRTKVVRNVAVPQGLRVTFSAMEKDGLLGADPAMNHKTIWLTHQYDGNGWTGGRKIELVTGKPTECGIRVDYSIVSEPVK
jgi:hypothetical protein